MELLRMQVGKPFPIQKVVDHFKDSEGGASLDYNDEDKTLSMYVGIPRPTSKEVGDFRNGIIRFALYPNEELNTAIIMVFFGRALVFDLIYDINVLHKNMDGKLDGNRFDIHLIDSKTGILRGMRLLGLGENFMKELNRITHNDGRYTTEEYNKWLETDVFTKSVPQLWEESKRIDWDN